MTVKKINKEQIKELIKEAAKTYTVFAPVENTGADVFFQSLPINPDELESALNRVSLNYDDIVISPKDIFFPQFEEMFKIENNSLKETAESSAKFLFGVRPCDLAGIIFSDEFFKRNYEDSYYQSRIQNRFIVSIGCIKPPRPECFCVSAETGPFAKAGYDLQLIDDGKGYFVEIGSEKGEEFVKKQARLFSDSEGNKDKAINEIKQKAAAAVELKVDFQKACRVMSDEKFIPEDVYKRISQRCIYCGACLYSCPTCSCFNVFDDVDAEGRGVRARNWDGCVFEGYTREASGHNPRKAKWLRAARRYEHKLKYDPKVAKVSGCVGCGRCLSSCPVNLGMSKFIQEITKK